MYIVFTSNVRDGFTCVETATKTIWCNRSLYAKICKNPRDYQRCEKLQLAFIRSLAFHSIQMLIYPFWIKDTCAYHCVIKSVPMVKIGAEVRLTSVPFRLLSVPFISIPPNRGGSNLQSHCSLSSSQYPVISRTS